jgi:hypothetical protein
MFGYSANSWKVRSDPDLVEEDARDEHGGTPVIVATSDLWACAAVTMVDGGFDPSITATSPIRGCWRAGPRLLQRLRRRLGGQEAPAASLDQDERA